VSRRRIQIAVVGAARCDARLARLAEEVGRGVAEAGATVVCGGLGGVMTAVARGAHAVGGTVVGVLPGYSHADGNAHLDVVLPTGLGHARNAVVAAAGDAVIALPGAAGTRSEVALARALGRPVIALGRETEEEHGVTAASTPADAVRRAVAAARRRLQVAR